MENNLKKINKILIFLLFSFVLVELPYFNLFLNRFWGIVFVYFYIAYLFKISSRINFIFGIILLLISIPWLLVGNRIGVEEIGIFAFIVFLLATLQEASKLRKEIK